MAFKSSPRREAQSSIIRSLKRVFLNQLKSAENDIPDIAYVHGAGKIDVSVELKDDRSHGATYCRWPPPVKNSL